jgi:hypothetical protein
VIPAGGQDQTWAPAPAYGRRRRRRWPLVLAIILVVLVALAVAADFIARSVAQSRVAAQIQQQGFPKKPTVSIEGFPFLTQVVSRDIHQIRISAQNVTDGPVQISSVSAVLTDVHLNGGFTGGTVDQVSGSLLVTFPALARTLTSQIGSLGSLASSAGLTLSAAGSDEVRASVNLVVASGSVTWRVSRLTGDEFDVKLVGDTGVPSSLLGSISDFTITIPRLPLGVQIGRVGITPQGLMAGLSGHDLSFGS